MPDLYGQGDPQGFLTRLKYYSADLAILALCAFAHADLCLACLHPTLCLANLFRKPLLLLQELTPS